MGHVIIESPPRDCMRVLIDNMYKDYKELTAQARHILAVPCIGKNVRYHGGNCQACALHGVGGGDNVTDYSGAPAPNYAGWARIYVQARKAIPARFARGFLLELASDNKSYAEELADDISHYGLTIHGI